MDDKAELPIATLDEIDEIYKAILNRKPHPNEGLLHAISAFEISKIDYNTHREKMVSLIQKIWGKCFIHFNNFHILFSSVILNSITSTSQETQKTAYYNVIKNLYYRASQQYLEIQALLKNGFPEGAGARWRSLYEIHCVIEFIMTSDNPEKLSKNYLKLKSCKRYEWAREDSRLASNNKKIGFWEIEKHTAQPEEYRTNYNITSETIHASARGTFSRLGNSSRDYAFIGFEVSAVNSVVILNKIVQRFIATFTDRDNTEIIKLLNFFCINLSQEFIDVEEKALQQGKELYDGIMGGPLPKPTIDEVIESLLKQITLNKDKQND